MALSVAWVCSLARSGSSIASYAAAAGFGCPVADEIFGPWDRTVEPYNYPPEQWQLVQAFVQANYTVDSRCVSLASEVFEKIATLGERGAGTTDADTPHSSEASSSPAPASRVVTKYPHLIEPPGMFENAFADHGFAYLLRNPLHRLNSLYIRNWVDAISSNYDMDRYKAFARQWLVQPYGLLYDDLRRDPAAFFQRLYRAWGWPATDAHVARAVHYVQSTYHADSAVVESAFTPTSPVSEQRMLMPVEAVEMYLGDPFILALMERVGWSLKAEDYLPSSLCSPTAPSP